MFGRKLITNVRWTMLDILYGVGTLKHELKNTTIHNVLTNCHSFFTLFFM